MFFTTFSGTRRFIGLVFFCFSIFPQEILHDLSVVNIEVAVRVFQGDKFIENLTLADFEIYEDGQQQKLEAVYLVKKTKIHRKDEIRKFAPDTLRNYYLFFEIAEFTPKLDLAVTEFVQNVMLPGDNVTIITPMNTYRMKSNTLAVLPKKEIVRQFREILLKDALIGNSEYRNILEELTAIARAIAAPRGDEVFRSFDPASDSFFRNISQSDLVTRYSSLLRILSEIRRVDQRKLLEFAQQLRSQPGQKNVFFFYQRDYLPKIDPDKASLYMGGDLEQPSLVYSLRYLSDFFFRDLSLDIEKVKKALSDSSIVAHFLFYTKPLRHVAGVTFAEDTSNLMQAFNEMAQATGGIADSSANPESLFKKAAKASENYYLLYYAPKKYAGDGAFKNIEVRIKNKKYTLNHRAGYYAN
jgi:hypothetical protein